MVTLVSGSNRLEIDASPGLTVGSIRGDYETILTIPANAVATVNGNAADATTRVRAGDEVAFTRPTGQKG